MSIDLSKLTPAPWEADESHLVHGRSGTLRETPGFAKFESDNRNEDAAFCALARNAFDVMMRRGWYACRDGFDGESFVGWIVCSRPTKSHCPNVMGRHKGPISSWPDPFTALVEADKWYQENVENKPTAP